MMKMEQTMVKNTLNKIQQSGTVMNKTVAKNNIKTAENNTVKTAMKKQKNIKARVMRYLRKNYNTNILNAKFPQTRRHRIKKLAARMNVPAKHVYAWKVAGSENLMSSIEPNFTTTSMSSSSPYNRDVSQKTILHTRHQIARYNAGIMYNEVLRKTNMEHYLSEESKTCIIPENRDTVLVVVDLTLDNHASDAGMEMLCRSKNKEAGTQMSYIQTALPSDNILIPTVRINFKSILDRPGQANKTLFGSKSKNARIFGDTDGINTSSLQILDRYLADAKKIVGIDYKMIVVHDDNLYFPDELNHFVHGPISQLLPLVASRVSGIKLKKVYQSL
jgi:hypothetical protein